MSHMNPVVVAGAGISGLALAFELRRLGVPVVVLESASRAGGKIESDHRDGFLCERGPASFLDRSGALIAMAKALGIDQALVYAGDAAERRLVAADGRLHDTPGTVAEFAWTQLLSWSGKLRASLDLLLPRGPSARGRDESVAAFARRRLGTQAGERLLQPLVSGLYAGDPERISLPSAFPLVAEMERKQRSFTLAMRKELAKARKKAAPRRTMPTAALASSLDGDLHLDARVVGLAKQRDGFRVSVEEKGQASSLVARAVVLAVPAYVAGPLLV